MIAGIGKVTGCSRPEPTSAIAAMYHRFAAVEAAGRSPVYAEITDRISRDACTLAFLAALPPPKRQPNLLLAAVQYLRGPLTGWAAFADALAEPDEIAHVIRTRSTQTNIPARCATLLPALAQLPQPLALVEVGASAGLCLYPDRYGYDYGAVVLPGVPTFRCTANPATPLPDKKVDIVWRAGLDLNPLDATDPDDRAWLDALVWPGEEHLRDQLHAAVEVAAADPPHLVRGDLLTDLPTLIADAPRDATLVVCHTAVLMYVDDPADRRRFAENVRASGAVWLANEHPDRIAGLEPVHDHPDGMFLLCRDGHPLARTDPHGSRIDWL
jgi:hypothetical protein